MSLEAAKDLGQLLPPPATALQGLPALPVTARSVTAHHCPLCPSLPALRICARSAQLCPSLPVPVRRRCLAVPARCRPAQERAAGCRRALLAGLGASRGSGLGGCSHLRHPRLHFLLRIAPGAGRPLRLSPGRTARAAVGGCRAERRCESICCTGKAWAMEGESGESGAPSLHGHSAGTGLVALPSSPRQVRLPSLLGPRSRGGSGQRRGRAGAPEGSGRRSAPLAAPERGFQPTGPKGLSLVFLFSEKHYQQNNSRTTPLLSFR